MQGDTYFPHKIKSKGSTFIAALWLVVVFSHEFELCRVSLYALKDTCPFCDFVAHAVSLFSLFG